MVECMYPICDLLWRQREVPEEWKKVIIVLLHKGKGSKEKEKEREKCIYVHFLLDSNSSKTKVLLMYITP